MSNTALQYPGALNSLERNVMSSLSPVENQQLNVLRGNKLNIYKKMYTTYFMK